MQIERRMRVALACGALGLLAITGACLSPDWPQTVQSGSISGDKAGGSAETPDATAPEESGTGDDEGGTGDEVATAGETCITSAGVCQYVQATSASGFPCAGQVGAATCATAGLVGCCTVASASNTIESCYYNTQAAGSTAATCVSPNIFSAAQ